MKKLKLSAVAGTAAVVALLLSGCSSSSTPSTSSSAAASSSSAAPSSSAAETSAAVSSPSASGEAPASSSTGAGTPASSGSASGADLKVGKTSLGMVVTDSKGLTAYYFTKDVKGSGKSVCSGQCLVQWPAITTTSAKPTVEGVTGTVGTITRDDGSKQITIDGRPIYTWFKDSKAGDVTGQEVGGVWYAVAPDGSQIGT